MVAQGVALVSATYHSTRRADSLRLRPGAAELVGSEPRDLDLRISNLQVNGRTDARAACLETMLTDPDFEIIGGQVRDSIAARAIDAMREPLRSRVRDGDGALGERMNFLWTRWTGAFDDFVATRFQVDKVYGPFERLDTHVDVLVPNSGREELPTASFITTMSGALQSGLPYNARENPWP